MSDEETMTTILAGAEFRTRVLLRLIGSASKRPQGITQRHCSGKISIGDVTKSVKEPKNPELVPIRYLPKSTKEIPPETLKHLKWMMQKDILGQDIFLIGRPSPLRRSLAMQYLELTKRELEYVALSR